jgi:hypothetical protein
MEGVLRRKTGNLWGREEGAHYMVDAEVLRLRKLRNVALRARALGKSLDSNLDAGDSVFARGGALCWTIARIATGRLRAHPYLSYQKGHGEIAALADAAISAALASAAQRQQREFRVFAEHLQAVAREVDDVRSLSLSPDLSDALGRMQIHMRRLVGELECKLPMQQRRNAAAADKRRPSQEIAVEGSWPYLAI